MDSERLSGDNRAMSFHDLTRDQMIARMADPTADGLFIVAVRTTGIYCRPSCRPPRRPLPVNVDFHASPTDARAAGFRACKLCRPDEPYPPAETDRRALEAALARFRADPGSIDTVGDLARSAHLSASQLYATCRRVGLPTPAALIAGIRLESARAALVAEEGSVADVAFGAGFGSLSAFNAAFRREYGTTPTSFRRAAG